MVFFFFLFFKNNLPNLAIPHCSQHCNLEPTFSTDNNINPIQRKKKWTIITNHDRTSNSFSKKAKQFSMWLVQTQTDGESSGLRIIWGEAWPVTSSKRRPPAQGWRRRYICCFVRKFRLMLGCRPCPRRRPAARSGRTSGTSRSATAAAPCPRACR